MSENPITDLIGALRSLESTVHGGTWGNRTVNGDPWLCLMHARGRMIVKLQLQHYEVEPGEAHRPGWHADAHTTVDALATILNTAIELASLAYTVDHLQEQLIVEHGVTAALTERLKTKEYEVERLSHLAVAHARAVNLYAEAADEVRRLQFGVAVGLERLAECPSCRADRTNGERHDDGCPIVAIIQRQDIRTDSRQG